MNFVASLGARALAVLHSFGHAAFFFLDLLRAIPPAMRRFGLVVVQIHAIGNRSLIIILSSGLAVGFVLALQMYYALVTYGAAESLGLIVNLALVRELGPVVTGLLFAGRAGTSLTAEIGLMKAGEQIAAMEMMAIDPKSRVLAPRFIAGMGVDAHPGDPVFRDRHPRGLRRRGPADRRGRRQLLVDHAEQGRRLA
jgi:phospholipid/cholesterol/gamma-HCH transport system permease protein